jgi:hypothetical protein
MQNLIKYQTRPYDDIIVRVEVVPGTEGRYSDLHETWDEAHHYLYNRVQAQIDKIEAALRIAREHLAEVEKQQP